MIAPLTPRQIERRAPLWSALTELFLDTELTDDDIDRIATTIAQSGWSARDAEAILASEIAPAFFWNLLSATGEWAGWSDATVQAIVLRRLARSRPRRWLDTVFARLARRRYAAEWRQVVDRMASQS